VAEVALVDTALRGTVLEAEARLERASA